MFELRRLRLLHELALRGTLAAVAEALAYSPSTISQQLTQLEKEAGVVLLAPDGRRVRLTEHGRILAAHAARALDLDERARGELESLHPGLAPVRVAVMQTAALAIVPAALALLAERAPHLRVELVEMPPERGLFELTARGVDLVIAEQYPGHTRAHTEGLDRATLGTDPIRLAVASADTARSLDDLRDRPWVMEPAGTAARLWAVQQCRAAGFEPDVRYELADLSAHARLVAAGQAVAVLPDLLWEGAAAPVTLLDLPGRPTREIFSAQRTASQARAGILEVRRALRDAFPAASESGRLSP
ncbi:LysR family transcriptional regulator [Microbacterium sp. B35-04]|uniref:LysR family transcriptional regulator n=1 Tax=unclassified Microbacterium TaxID=2609290 RepID=UPI0013D02671|nr:MULTISPECIES: LysR family transcriptional regulator [unclassified Microbacterium]KAF2411838.1 LysR family transcriptional regulator [Microbacterium sp. B35-04]KAF2416179.1 LysR family transcriptional regulator [Microbacterium sp. B35-30]